ncbi:MAG: Ig-like domain repeat protein, partial [Spirochaetaceae bacterium]|nr:Ig-like domain repeat protein [Spirochaetaceae bacterium]
AFSFSAEDDAGNLATLSGRTFVVDNTPPNAPTGITSGEIISGYVNGETSFETFDLTVYYSAQAGDLLTLSGALSGYSRLLGTGETSSYTFTIDRDDLGIDGPKTIYAGLTDIAGNVGALSSGYSFTLDRAVPATPSIGSTELTSGGYVNGEDPHISFDIITSDLNASMGDSVQLSGLSGTYTYLFPLAASEYTFTNVLRADLGSQGYKEIRARIISRAGNIGPYSSPFIVTLDTSDPVITISSYTPDYEDNSRIRQSGTDTVNIRASVTDTVAFTGPPALRVNGGSAIDMTYVSGSSWEYTWDIPSGSANDGSYAFSFSAEDDAGNLATLSGRTFVVDNTAPAGYSFSSYTYTSPNIIFEITGIIESSPQVQASYVLTSDQSGGGGGLESINGITDLKSHSGDFSQTIDISDLHKGYISCTIRMIDEVGNEGDEVTAPNDVEKK